jgi:predicted Zn-dependent peptidase
LLALVVRDRLRAISTDLATAFARHEAHDLPGVFVLGASVPSALASKAVSGAQDVMTSLAKTGPTVLEFEHARQELLAEISRQSSQEDSREATADTWLAIEIYKLTPAATQIRNLTLADTQRVATRLFKDAALAKIVVGDAEQLKSSFGGIAEVRGAKSEVKTATDPVMPTKKP